MNYTGGFGAPYRAPCGGWPAKPVLVLGDCLSAYMPPAPVAKYLNTTQVSTYRTTGPSTIPPYQRPYAGMSACNSGSSPDGDPFCAPWPEVVPDNTYGVSGTVNTPSPCLKVGFKNAFAAKAWHGRYGFGTGDACCPSPLNKPAIDASPSSTRYRTMSWDATVSFVGITRSLVDDPGGHDPAFNTYSPSDPSYAAAVPDTVYHQTGSVTIDRLSGKKTGTATNIASGHIYSMTGYGQDTGDGPIITPAEYAAGAKGQFDSTQDYGSGVGIFPAPSTGRPDGAPATCKVINDLLTGFGYCRTKAVGIGIVNISAGVLTTNAGLNISRGDYIDVQGNTGGGNISHAKVTAIDLVTASPNCLYYVSGLPSSTTADGYVVIYQWSPSTLGLPGFPCVPGTADWPTSGATAEDGVLAVGLGLGKVRAVYLDSATQGASTIAVHTTTPHGLANNDYVSFWNCLPNGGFNSTAYTLMGSSPIQIAYVDAYNFTVLISGTTGAAVTSGYFTTALKPDGSLSGYNGGMNTARDVVQLTFTGETKIRFQFDPSGVSAGPGPTKIGTFAGTGTLPMPKIDITVTLSDPYTSDDLNDDADALLLKWDLTDDDVYPWRTDLDVTAGPLLTRLEQTPNAPDFQPYGFTDPSPLDGRILGAPNPFGYDPFWDFRAINLVPDMGLCEAASVGANPPAYLPQTATQWTNLGDQCSLLPYEFRAFNTLNFLLNPSSPPPYLPGYLIASKYAEIKVPWFSHNFARPCGPKDLATIDQIDVAHGGSFDCANPSPFGNYRWAGKPCFCNDPSQTVGCGTPANPTDVNQWNDNQPKGDFTIVSYGFNFRDDNTARPDTNYVNAISATDYCLPFTPCSPAVICISRNGESFTNGLTIAPGRLTVDGCYGAQRQTMVRQWMQDPLWQYPHALCPSGLRIEDDGSGTVVGADFPLRPFEESRTTVPAGAPGLPAGYYLNILSAADINAGTTTGQNLYPPPQSPGGDGACNVLSLLAPFVPVWFYYSNMLANIAAGGNFACDYNDPLAICGDDPEVVP